MRYAYGMKMRGFSPGCQPIDGFLERRNDPSGRFYDILIYDRELPSGAPAYYDLVYLGTLPPEQCESCQYVLKCADLNCLKDKPCSARTENKKIEFDEIRY